MDIALDELEGKYIRVVPMERNHIQGLYEASNDLNIWTHLPKTIKTLNDMEGLVDEALSNKELGTEFPFVILLRENNKLIGSTRFLDISNVNKNLEIGWTWLSPFVWGSQINIECKYLLLAYCFDTLQMIRVQFKTDHQNIRSQKAIERIGGVKEGILRNHKIRKDGTFRHSVFYSIIESEWPAVKLNLEKYYVKKFRHLQ
ncbi:GNAT family N-acetyltransferase [Pseudogracilibacillus auburnensis]|uniref:Acetyltransferase (GNAT) family protein n=1 Tax=Pseudogracilibacillus auburnensis TaxID=1494959 RepID=A0A2V3VHX7_9BACI|nr:GNAT family protein [Pseudogracilibacillus auburnensis]MBO1004986.1 GNAT family N-acetyltransferase [Pseudogracilibacillus auburnensis]PXW81446.1 acetyltransferase (GNAT) family protein [Pseudogracilibacillus auburnensis]